MQFYALVTGSGVILLDVNTNCIRKAVQHCQTADLVGDRTDVCTIEQPASVDRVKLISYRGSIVRSHVTSRWDGD
jgi:hypothetical protein